MNRYPVLFLSLKDVEGLSFESAFIMLQKIVAHVCVKHGALLNDDRVDPYDVVRFNRLKAEKASLEDIQESLFIIMRMMKVVYDDPVILLMDEYDVPLAKA